MGIQGGITPNNHKNHGGTQAIYQNYRQILYPAQISPTPSNQEIIELAGKKTQQDTANSPLGKFTKLMPKLFTAGIIASIAATKNGPLSHKLGNGAKYGALIFAAGGIFKGLSKIFEKTSAKPNNKKDTNPTLKTIGVIAGAIGVATLTFFAFMKDGKFIGGTQIGKKAGNALADLGNKIDNTPIGKAVDNFRAKYQNFCAKHPVINKNILKNSFGLLFFGYIATSIFTSSKLASQNKQMFQQNVNELAQKRNDTEKQYAKITLASATNHVPQSDAECDNLVIATQKEIAMTNMDLKNINNIYNAK